MLSSISMFFIFIITCCLVVFLHLSANESLAKKIELVQGKLNKLNDVDGINHDNENTNTVLNTVITKINSLNTQELAQQLESIDTNFTNLLKDKSLELNNTLLLNNKIDEINKLFDSSLVKKITHVNEKISNLEQLTVRSSKDLDAKINILSSETKTFNEKLVGNLNEKLATIDNFNEKLETIDNFNDKLLPINGFDEKLTDINNKLLKHKTIEKQLETLHDTLNNDHDSNKELLENLKIIKNYLVKPNQEMLNNLQSLKSKLDNLQQNPNVDLITSLNELKDKINMSTNVNARLNKLDELCVKNTQEIVSKCITLSPTDVTSKIDMKLQPIIKITKDTSQMLDKLSESTAKQTECTKIMDKLEQTSKQHTDIIHKFKLNVKERDEEIDAKVRAHHAELMTKLDDFANKHSDVMKSAIKSSESLVDKVASKHTELLQTQHKDVMRKISSLNVTSTSTNDSIEIKEFEKLRNLISEQYSEIMGKIQSINTLKHDILDKIESMDRVQFDTHEKTIKTQYVTLFDKLDSFNGTVLNAIKECKSDIVEDSGRQLQEKFAKLQDIHSILTQINDYNEQFAKTTKDAQTIILDNVKTQTQDVTTKMQSKIHTLEMNLKEPIDQLGRDLESKLMKHDEKMSETIDRLKSANSQYEKTTNGLETQTKEYLDKISDKLEELPNTINDTFKSNRILTLDDVKSIIIQPLDTKMSSVEESVIDKIVDPLKRAMKNNVDTIIEPIKHDLNVKSDNLWEKMEKSLDNASDVICEKMVKQHNVYVDKIESHNTNVLDNIMKTRKDLTNEVNESNSKFKEAIVATTHQTIVEPIMNELKSMPKQIKETLNPMITKNLEPLTKNLKSAIVDPLLHEMKEPLIKRIHEPINTLLETGLKHNSEVLTKHMIKRVYEPLSKEIEKQSTIDAALMKKQLLTPILTELDKPLLKRIKENVTNVIVDEMHEPLAKRMKSDVIGPALQPLTKNVSDALLRNLRSTLQDIIANSIERPLKDHVVTNVNRATHDELVKLQKSLETTTNQTEVLQLLKNLNTRLPEVNVHIKEIKDSIKRGNTYSALSLEQNTNRILKETEEPLSKITEKTDNLTQLFESYMQESPCKVQMNKTEDIEEADFAELDDAEHDEAIDKNEESTVEDTTSVRHDYDGHVQNVNLTINIPSLLDGFAKSYATRSEYDGKKLNYPKLIDKINVHSVGMEIFGGTTKYNDWHENSSLLRIIAAVLLHTLAVDIHYNKPEAHPSVKLFIDKFIHEFKRKYNHTGGIPWGKESTGFIEVSYLIALYAISPYSKDTKHQQESANIIQKIINKPNFVFKNPIPLSRVIYASTPWILSQKILNQDISAENLNIIKTATLRKYCDVTNNGFHLDKSFSFKRTFDFALPNKLCIKYKYELLELLIDEFKQPTMLTMTKATKQLNEIIIHPKIKCSKYGINTLNLDKRALNSSDIYSIPENNYGLRVMPLCKLLRLFTHSHSFIVRGMMEQLHYLPEMKNNQMQKRQLYSVQNRTICSLNNTVKQNFGEISWMNPEHKSRPNVTIKNTQSFVGLYNKIGAFYQTYEVVEEKMDGYVVEEFIQLKDTESEQIIDLNIKITNKSQRYDIVYFGYIKDVSNRTTEQYSNEETIFTIEHGKTQYFTTKLMIDRDELRVIEHTTQHNDPTKFTYPLKLNDHLTVVREQNAFIIMKNPNILKVYCPSFGGTKFIANPHFKYNEPTNQWITN